MYVLVVLTMILYYSMYTLHVSAIVNMLMTVIQYIDNDVLLIKLLNNRAHSISYTLYCLYHLIDVMQSSC